MERSSYKKLINFDVRFAVVCLLMLAAALVLAGQMAHLQLVMGEELAGQANRSRRVPLEAPRGVIRDFRGRLLVDNAPVFSVAVYPRDVETSKGMASVVNTYEMLGWDEDEALRTLKSIHSKTGPRNLEPYTEIILRKNITVDEVAKLEEHYFEMPELRVQPQLLRRCRWGPTAAHVLGYLGEVTGADLAGDSPYRMGNLIGKSGVEKVMEDTLRGEEGKMIAILRSRGQPLLQVDSYGRPIIAADNRGKQLETVSKERRDPEAGDDVSLTLDIELQSLVMDILDGIDADWRQEDPEDYLAGAVVVLDAETGAVRAMVSYPSYDPSVFVDPGAQKELAALLRDPQKRKTLRNRAISGAYAPGSVFKMVIAYAALKEGVVKPDTKFDCSGYAQLFPTRRPFRCWRWEFGGHGPTDLMHAIAYSCDVYFYNVGLNLGIDTIASYAKQFGYGTPTGIDLPGETAGVLPSRKWKKENFRGEQRSWFPGDTVVASIGQGYVTATPLQQAKGLAFILNGGCSIQPHVVASPARNIPPHQNDGPGDKSLSIILSALERVVDLRKPRAGTGAKAAIEGMRIIGKTGTSQVIAQAREDPKNQKALKRKLRDHAWFVCGVVDRKPRLVVSIFLENAGVHGSAAAPIARRIIRHAYGLPPEKGILTLPKDWNEPDEEPKDSEGTDKTDVQHAPLLTARAGLWEE
ncbi:penicillin-binding protein 2 [Candidatus Hydrogenedentota bacterium]